MPQDIEDWEQAERRYVQLYGRRRSFVEALNDWFRENPGRQINFSLPAVRSPLMELLIDGMTFRSEHAGDFRWNQLHVMEDSLSIQRHEYDPKRNLRFVYLDDAPRAKNTLLPFDAQVIKASVLEAEMDALAKKIREGCETIIIDSIAGTPCCGVDWKTNEHTGLRWCSRCLKNERKPEKEVPE